MAGRVLELALAIKGKIDNAIPESLRQVANSMEDLQRRSASLNNTARNASAWTRQAQSLRQLSQEMRQAQANVRACAAALQQSDGATSAAQQAYAQAQARVRQLSGALSDERVRLQQTSAELQKAGFNTDDFAASQRRLQDAITQNNRVMGARRNLESARNKQDAAGARLANANMNLQAGVDMGRVLTAPLAEATEKAMDFESAMSDVRKVVDFDTPQQFKEMSNDILALSQKLPMTANDIAKIVAAGGQSGIAREDLMSFAESAVKMGVAFDVTADQAGDMMAKWRTAFKMSQPEVVSLADKINYLGNTTAASAPLISDVVTRIGPLGEIGGVASGEIAALGASMVGTGVQSDVAATGIKNLILGMVAGEGATKTQAEAFEKLGMSATDVAKRMQTDAKGAIIDLMKALQALPKEEQAATLADLFGKESIGAISPLLSNLDALQDNFNKVADASQYAGSMEAEYQARSATTANKIQLAKNAVTALAISIGSSLLPIIGNIAEAVAPVLQGFAAWASNNQMLIATIAGVAAAVGGIIVALLAMSVVVFMVQYVADSITALKAAFEAAKVGALAASAATKAFAVAQAVLNAVMSANPLAIAIIAVVALAAALIYLWNTNETFRTAVINAWNQIKDAAMQVWAAIAPYIEAAWETIKSVVSSGIEFIKGVWAGIAPYAATAFNAVVTAISAVIGIIGTIISTIISVIAAVIPVIASIFGGIASVLGAAFGIIVSVVSTVISGIGAAFSVIVTVVSAVFSVIATIVQAGMFIIKAIIVVFAVFFAAFWTGVINFAIAAWQLLAPYVTAVMNGIMIVVQTAGTIISAVWNTILTVAMMVWGLIGPYVIAVITGIVAIVQMAVAVISAAWNTILAVAMAVWGAIGPYVVAIVDTIMAAISAAGAFIESVWDAIYNTASAAWNAIVGVVQGVIDQVIGIVQSGVQWVEDKWAHLKEVFSSPITAVVNFVKNGSSEAQSAAEEAGASAKGGVFRKPYLTWVAEAGDPEVIVPINRSARSMALWQTAGRMLGVLPQDSPNINQQPNIAPILPTIERVQEVAAPGINIPKTSMTESSTTAEKTPVAMAPSVHSNEVNLEFKPTVNIQGDAGTDIRDMVNQALREQARQFKEALPRMLRDIRANDRRLSYE